MTGFGRASGKSKYGTITVEIRSLNHKFFETSIKLPNGLAGFEDRVKKLLQKSLKRGKIYLNVSSEDKIKDVNRISVDGDVAKAYRRELNNLKKSLNLKGDVRLDQFLTLPGVITYDAPKLDGEKVWSYVRKALNEALQYLMKDREKEGKELYRDLYKRTKDIGSLLKSVDKRSDVSVSNYKKRLAKKIKELTGTQTIDKGRLAQEVAMFAKNCDISEELTRMQSHLAALGESLKSEQEVGKKLDFIAQELHREINTVCAKSSDFKISKWAIQIKSEVEKIREQVKNIE